MAWTCLRTVLGETYSSRPVSRVERRVGSSRRITSSRSVSGAASSTCRRGGRTKRSLGLLQQRGKHARVHHRLDQLVGLLDQGPGRLEDRRGHGAPTPAAARRRGARPCCGRCRVKGARVPRASDAGPRLAPYQSRSPTLPNSGRVVPCVALGGMASSGLLADAGPASVSGTRPASLDHPVRVRTTQAGISILVGVGSGRRKESE